MHRGRRSTGVRRARPGSSATFYGWFWTRSRISLALARPRINRRRFRRSMGTGDWALRGRLPRPSRSPRLSFPRRSRARNPPAARAYESHRPHRIRVPLGALRGPILPAGEATVNVSQDRAHAISFVCNLHHRDRALSAHSTLLTIRSNRKELQVADLRS
jgi:hypothetical protein